jgi:hypothetical protein
MRKEKGCRTPSEGSFTVRLAAAIVVQLGVIALLLFLPAGTWNWWQAWAYLTAMAVFSVWSELD